MWRAGAADQIVGVLQPLLHGRVEARLAAAFGHGNHRTRFVFPIAPDLSALSTLNAFLTKSRPIVANLIHGCSFLRSGWNIIALANPRQALLIQARLHRVNNFEEKFRYKMRIAFDRISSAWFRTIVWKIEKI